MGSHNIALDGKVALVTGGSRGNRPSGFRSDGPGGPKVTVNYRTRAADTEEVCAEIGQMGGRAIAIQADVSVGGEVQG